MIEPLEKARYAVSTVTEGCADQILDMLEFASGSENPGKCVRCYFAIFHRVARESSDHMLPLRRWIEQHIEIVAKDDHDQEIERLPVRFEDHEDLQAFCERSMREFHEDRVYSFPTIHLGFAFRQAAEKAA
ncbi:MAG: hypothetical protein AAF491_06500 [Verrucomicrobiota bacterium]